MTTYYVSTSGNNDNNGDSIARAWRSVDYAANRNSLEPGDEIRILPGTYVEEVRIFRSRGAQDGAAGRPITFTAHDAEKMPVIRNKKQGSKHYRQIHVQDVRNWTFSYLCFKDYDGRGWDVEAVTRNIEGITIDHCRLLRQSYGTETPGHPIHIATKNLHEAHNIRVTDNYLYRCSPVDSNGTGNENITFEGAIIDGLIQGNILEECQNIAISQIGWGSNRAGYALSGTPQRIVIRNNKILNHDGISYPRGGNCIYLDKAPGPYVIENNVIDCRGRPNEKVTCVKLSAEPHLNKDIDLDGPYIIRNNVAIGKDYSYMLGPVEDRYGSGGQITVKIQPAFNVYLAHNVGIVLDQGDSSGFAPLQPARVEKLHVVNNVFDSRRKTTPCKMVNVRHTAEDDSQWYINGNLWHSANPDRARWEMLDQNYTSWATFSAAWDRDGQWNQVPRFEDEAKNDFRLKDGTPGSGKALPLTFTTNRGVDSDTILLKDARWFSDGFDVQGGDRIRVGEAETTIQSVDWANNRVVVDPPISWSIGAPVHYNYEGTAPSIGLSSSVSTIVDPNGPTITPPPPIGEGVELLSNRSFEKDDLSSNKPLTWRSFTAGRASFQIADGYLTVNVTDAGGNTQLFQHGFEVQEGRDYELVIFAQAATPGSRVQAVLQKHENAAYQARAKTSLSPSPAHREVKSESHLKPQAAAPTRAWLLIFPVTNGDIKFAHVSLRDVTDELSDNPLFRYVRRGTQRGSRVGVPGLSEEIRHLRTRRHDLKRKQVVECWIHGVLLYNRIRILWFADDQFIAMLFDDFLDIVAVICQETLAAVTGWVGYDHQMPDAMFRK